MEDEEGGGEGMDKGVGETTVALPFMITELRRRAKNGIFCESATP